MSMEGHRDDSHRYNASFYKEQAAIADTWTKIEFIDHLGEQFESMHIKLKAISKDCYYSFDPREVDAAERTVQGLVKEGETVFLKDKHANEIYLMRSTINNATLQVTTWR